MDLCFDEEVDDKIDLIALEMQHMAFSMELTMKREQVTQLRKDLETANYKINDLTRSLEVVQKSKEELEFHFNMSVKNTRSLEEKINNNKDIIMKNRTKQETLVFENQTLKELLGKAEAEIYEKTKIIEDMEAQRHCHSMYQKDIIEQNNKLRSFLDKCNGLLQKVIDKQNVLIEHSSINDMNKTLQKTIEFYKKTNEKLRNENTEIENKLIKAESFWRVYKGMIEDMHFAPPNKEYDLLCDELQKSKDNIKEDLDFKTNLIETLTLDLKKEKDTNAKLWDKINALERDMHLKKNDIATNTEDDSNIKSEIIEIVD